jgi:transposase
MPTVHETAYPRLKSNISRRERVDLYTPDCGVTSHSRHSRYWRKLRDLPMRGASVTLKVQMGRWRCRSRQCLRQIFTEHVDGVLLPHSQQTNRLSEVHRL